MSYLNFSPHLNVQNLRNKDLIDLIKINEYYSGCYSIIQEKNLRGVDILNLSENTLTAWKLPQWQKKKFLSLKETLLKDPGSLKPPEEEENLSDEPRKNISNTLTTIFKNKQKPKLPYKKHADDITPMKKEPDLNLIYDDDNYLKPQFENSVKKPKNVTNFERRPLKFPEKSKSFSSKSHDNSLIPTRKPVALPRPDLNDEENEYEPPPSHISRLNKPSSKLPLPPPPAEEIDEYELPPRFETKQPESTQEEDYEYIETEKDENDLPPPLPERSVVKKIETKKWSFLPVYMNVNKAQSPTNNAQVSSSSLPSNRNRKITPKSTQPISPVIDSKNSDTKATWSVSTRPLPPLPLAPASIIVDEIKNEESTYEDTEGKHQSEVLAEYGNITESTSTPFKSSNISELKSKTSRDHIDDLRSHLSANFKLRTSHPPRSKQSIFGDENKELKGILEKRHESHKETNETMNNTKAKKNLTVLKSQIRLPLPPTSLPKVMTSVAVQNTYFDEVINVDHISHNDFGHGSNGIKEDEASEDELPEYRNTTETKTKAPAWKSQPYKPSSISQLALEISTKKLKATSPKRDVSNSNWIVQEKPTPTFTEVASNSTLRDSYFEENQQEDDQVPEYLNTTETETKPQALKSQPYKTSPISQFALEISQKKLKPVSPNRKISDVQEKPTITKDIPDRTSYEPDDESDFGDEQDFLPEYLNTTDTQISEPKHHALPAANDSSSQITKFKVKSTAKDIHLNDKLADELRILLGRRNKGPNENVETGRVAVDSHPRTNLPNKPIQNSSANIAEIEDDDMDDIEQEDYDVAGSYSDLFNFNNEPFYRNTDRKGAIALLRDLEDGAFLLRPSRKFFLSITIKNRGKYFNLGIEKTPQNKIFCGEGMMRTQEFFSLRKFLEHFEHNPLVLQGEKGLEEVYLKKVLPQDRF